MKYLLVLLIFVFPMLASATTLRIDGPTTLHQGDQGIVSLTLVTEGEIVNAVDGSIRIPEGMRLSDIRLSGSVVPFWVEEPREREPGIVSFSGVMPGGYQNSSDEKSIEGNVLTLVIESETEGSHTFVLTPATAVYLNDGDGTPASLTRDVLTVAVTGAVGTSLIADLVPDITGPEEFTPERVAGEPFGLPGDVLVFIANDKDSGITGYELARSFLPLPVFLLSWNTVTSPASLTDSDDYGFVYIRATDTHENSTVAIALPGGPLRAFLPTLALVVLIGVVFLFLRRGIIRK